MKIETKFNIGDKVYYIENEKILELEITNAVVVLTKKDSYFVQYHSEDKQGVLYFSLETELFDTVEKAFQSLIENLKVKYNIE